MKTKMPKREEDVHVIFDGRMVELFAKLAFKIYQEYVHQKRGQAYIYYRVTVDIYGTLKTALLFWKKLSNSLKQQGCVINPYDWCVANKDVLEKNAPWCSMWMI